MGPKVLKPILRKINRNYINQFDFCWIPDTDQKINLSGDLSSYTNDRCFKIGPLSRFSKYEKNQTNININLLLYFPVQNLKEVFLNLRL